ESNAAFPTFFQVNRVGEFGFPKFNTRRSFYTDFWIQMNRLSWRTRYVLGSFPHTGMRINHLYHPRFFAPHLQQLTETPTLSP
ncbi:MAG: hypothetical protein AAF570_27035, partial [Bacteroidota bacterium]